MSAAAVTILECQEFQTLALPAAALSQAVAAEIRQRYADYVELDAPNCFVAEWRIRPRSYVGYLPLAANFALYLQPKVPLQNVFGMLEYAHGTELELFDSNFEAASLQEFFERLANILAQRVLARARRGFHRTYIG